MRRATGRTLAVTLGTGPQDGATVAALRLAAAAVVRGHGVAVFAHGEGVRASATGSATADHVAGLLRAGLHVGGVAWVSDATAIAQRCATTEQVVGVLSGDGGDLWQFVRDADVSLGVSR